MNVDLICVGGLKERYLRDAVDEYVKRLKGYCRIEITEVQDERTPDAMSERERGLILEREAERVRRHLATGSGVWRIALCIDGVSYSSEAWADHLESLKVSGKSRLQLVIGGSLGLDERLIGEMDEKLSFSEFTFPHQLMRVILLEQLYRSFRISSGEPYHK